MAQLDDGVEILLKRSHPEATKEGNDPIKISSSIFSEANVIHPFVPS